MSKIGKRIGALFIAVWLSAGLCLSAMAANATATAEDTGTITVSGLEDNVTVTAYKIVEAEYDELTGYFTGYKMLYTPGTDGLSFDQYGKYDEEALTEENLAAIFAQVSGTTYKAVTSVSGTATFEDMEAGSYLFVVTGAESSVYGMVIGSVSYTTTDGEWDLNQGEINVENSTVWVKSSKPQIEKTEKGGSLDDFEHGGSANVGDTLSFEIKVSPIPSYQGEYPEFEIVDQISDNLSITDEELANLIVKIGDVTLTKGTDYTVERIDGGFEINFVVEGVYTLNEYAGSNTIVIDYDADVISADGIENDSDHTNEATLNFSTSSYVFEQDSSVEDTDHDYTFNVLIMKTDGNDPLAGAKFGLYMDAECLTEYTQNGTVITAVSGSDGYFEFTGLQEGEYYLREIEAPAGYALNDNLYKVTISAFYDESGVLQDSFSIIVTDETNGGAIVGSAIVSDSDAVIVNTILGELPSMGSNGALTITLIGCGVVLAAAVVVVIVRRKNSAA